MAQVRKKPRVAALKKPRTVIAGNWKMNGLKSDLREAKSLVLYLARSSQRSASSAEVVICPPATLIYRRLARCFVEALLNQAGKIVMPMHQALTQVMLVLR